MAQYNDFTGQLYNTYEEFRENSITDRRFKHSDIKPLIDKLKSIPLFTVKQAGLSAQNRELYLISTGHGKTKVFLWSQMHGDESTATMALFDIFNFFSRENRFEEIKNLIRNELTVYFLPMVNPD
ncbi:MAG TPA: M14 family zinc carboxypeptidase, partial [Ignavibacteriaceae bacterium]